MALLGALLVCPVARAVPQAASDARTDPVTLGKGVGSAGLSVRAAGQASPSAQTAPVPPASLYGTVVGPGGALLAGARITLAGKVTRTATTRDNGEFSFTGVPAGKFRLTASGPGMRTVTVQGIVLQPGSVRFLRQIVLQVASAAATVRVVAPSEQLAEQQLQLQIHQRVLGVLPNFMSSYNWNAVHLWPKQKFQLALRVELDPVTFAVIGAEAGIEQGFGRYPGYGTGVEGYGKRFGADYASDFAAGMIGDALLPSILRQDPRYFYKGTGSFGSRAVYAVSRTILCRGDDGKTEFDYSRVVGDLAAAGISNLYYPAANRGAGLVIANGLIEVGGNAAVNLIREFILPGLTSRVPHAAKKGAVHLF